MKLSPQSEEIINKLLNGEKVNSGDLTIGPLDPNDAICLEILLENNNEMNELTGADRARKFLEHYKSNLAKIKKEQAENGRDKKLSSVNSAKILPIKSSNLHGWRIVELQASSYRGLAPFGTQVVFPFEGKSNLIFGTNGSGKSSLIGALIWVFTNTTLTDADEENEIANVHEQDKGTIKGKKLREWPICITLPGKEIKNCSPKGFVSLKMISTQDETILWLRRSYPGVLEKSSDEKVWSPCGKLGELGIIPLDVQLSLIAPIYFGRRRVEDIKEAKDILSLILGYEDLVNIGNLAANVAKNRTVLKNSEQKDVDKWKNEIEENFKELLPELGANDPIHNSLKILAAEKHLTEVKIEAVGKEINDEIEVAEGNIAKAIGIEEEPGEKLDGIGDSLTIVVEKLKRKFSEIFPSTAKIKLSSVLPPLGSKSPEEQLIELETSLKTYITNTQDKVKQRLELWKKEIVKNSKVTLFLYVASFYDPETSICPVCDQPIKKLEVKDQLYQLKIVPPELRKELKEIFRTLKDELEALIPPEVRSLGEKLPNNRIENDWASLKDSIPDTFQAVIRKYDKKVESIAKECEAQISQAPKIIPANCPEDFSEDAKDLVEEITNTFAILDILKWSLNSFLVAETKLNSLITADPHDNPDSLMAILFKGKEGADGIQSLNRVKNSLKKIYRLQKDITKTTKDILLLEGMVDPFKQIKNLVSFSETEVKRIFGKTEEAAMENWRTLYPESPSGLIPGNIILDNKGIEAMLEGKGFRVPSKYFANSGLQRAIALSFYFALLDKHPGGLGFILLDDTILSLDDEHRERWSNQILKPRMDNKQIILTTHQRAFLNNCRFDFSSGRIVELNNRGKNRGISYRPGNRLDRAKEELEKGSYTSAPPELRKYREELLATLDSYSPTPFFNHKNLTHSLTQYELLPDSNPVGGKFMVKITSILRDNVVERVLDPGSHALTEADISQPMVEDCLEKLKSVNRKLIDKIDYLDLTRRPARKARELSIQDEVIFPEIPKTARWKEKLDLKIIGAAAAKPESITIESSESFFEDTLNPGSAVCVSGDTLDPVAKLGQWVILAGEDISVQDGDLAAIQLKDQKRLLRRVWSDGDCWRMESINPINPRPIHSSFKNETAIRKIVGVLYEPNNPPAISGGSEWHPNDFQVIDVKSTLYCINVEGSSLIPVANPGQRVLIEEGKSIDAITISKGSLAVVETRDGEVGNVIKRIFPGSEAYILSSINPVENFEPIILPIEKIVKIWPLRGVLFEHFDN